MKKYLACLIFVCGLISWAAVRASCNQESTSLETLTINNGEWASPWMEVYTNGEAALFSGTPFTNIIFDDEYTGTIQVGTNVYTMNQLRNRLLNP